MRCLGAIFIGALLIPILMGGQQRNLVNRVLDIDSDLERKVLILNSDDFSVILLDDLPELAKDTLWSYPQMKDISFLDGELIDINNDGFKDLVLLPDLHGSLGTAPWIYLFAGNKNSFAKDPIIVEDTLLDIKEVRPFNISSLPNTPDKMVISLGSPSRCGVLLGIDIKANNASVKEPILLSSSLLINGYGSLISAGFSTNGKEYIAIISQENYDIKLAVFYIEDSPVLISEMIFTIENRDFIDSYGVKLIKQSELSKEGLLVPFKSGDSLLLELLGDNIYFTSISGNSRVTESDYNRNNFQNKTAVNKKSTRLIDRLDYEANPMNRPEAAAEIEI